jgi:hypothetical protein
MENKDITTHAELKMQIMQLRAEKFQQEDDLRQRFREFVYTIHPLSMMKKSLHDMAVDREVQFDFAKVGLNMGANFIIEKVLGKNNSIKGFIGSILTEKLSGSFINNNLPKIMSGFNKLLNRNSK